MNPTTFLLVLASSLGWSLFDVSRKKTGAALSPAVALFWYMLLTFPIFALWTWSTGEFHLGSGYWPYALAGIAVNFLANWIFIESVARSPLSSSVPMLAFVPALSALFSYLVLGETLGLVQCAGVLVIVVGALMLNGLPQWRGAQSGPWMMFVTALLWAMLLVLDKICLRSAAVPLHATLQTFGMVICSLILIFCHRKKRPLAKAFPKAFMALGVVGCFVGASLQLLAMPQADVGVIEAVKRASNMLLSFGMGVLWFSEVISPRKVLAMVILLGGTLMVLQVL